MPPERFFAPRQLVATVATTTGRVRHWSAIIVDCQPARVICELSVAVPWHSVPMHQVCASVKAVPLRTTVSGGEPAAVKENCVRDVADLRVNMLSARSGSTAPRWSLRLTRHHQQHTGGTSSHSRRSCQGRQACWRSDSADEATRGRSLAPLGVPAPRAAVQEQHRAFLRLRASESPAHTAHARQR